MIHFFCPQCWEEIEEKDTVCSKCQKRPSEFAEEAFTQKLIRALSHPERTTVLRAIWILGELQPREAVDPLIALLDRPGVDVYQQRALVKTLGKISTRKSLKILLRMLKHPASMVRLETVYALRSFKGKRVTEALLKVRFDPSPAVCQAVKEVLEERKSPLKDIGLRF